MKKWIIAGVMLGSVAYTQAGAQAGALAGTQAGAKTRGLALVTDAPYYGVREYDREQVRPDGKKVKDHEETKFWRDAAGKTRSERRREGSDKVEYLLVDPAGKVSYSWVSGSKLAYVHHYGEAVPAREPGHPLGAGEVRKVSVTDANGKRVPAEASLLPAKTIDGLETRGSHVVQFGGGYEAKPTATTDSWYQDALHLALETEITDERYGHRHFLFKTVKREAPSADRMELPKGLTVKEEETADTEQFE